MSKLNFINVKAVKVKVKSKSYNVCVYCTVESSASFSGSGRDLKSSVRRSQEQKSQDQDQQKRKFLTRPLISVFADKNYIMDCSCNCIMYNVSVYSCYRVSNSDLRSAELHNFLDKFIG